MGSNRGRTHGKTESWAQIVPSRQTLTTHTTFSPRTRLVPTHISPRPPCTRPLADMGHLTSIIDLRFLFLIHLLMENLPCSLVIGSRPTIRCGLCSSSYSSIFLSYSIDECIGKSVCSQGAWCSSMNWSTLDSELASLVLCPYRIPCWLFILWCLQIVVAMLMHLP